MTTFQRFERAAGRDLKAAVVREVLPLAVIVAVAVVLQQLTSHLSYRNP